jgi:hypothetical protein
MATVLVFVGPAVRVAVEDIEEDGGLRRSLDDDLVVEDGMSPRRARVVEEIERGVAAAANGPGRPGPHGNLHRIARQELGPTDARSGPFVVLFGRERDTAILPVDPRAENLGQISLRGNVLEELVLRARRDHILAGILDEL